MRTLLVDNHDSFTYNLWHALAEVNGEEPDVIAHDQRGWSLGELDAYDNVVISPGPGTPLRPADLGVSREIVRHATLPLLGVCLGHQALAHEAGGVIARAPEPRHGRRSPVWHDGEDILAGLPSPFEAVRYHSLAVSKLPAELAGLAWTPDGVLMALRHRSRPRWGVQFHPESILTEHGHRLLANFAELTRRHTPRRAPRPSRPPAAAGRAPARRRLRLLARTLPTRWQDDVVFARLFHGRPHAFWLDSSRTGAAAGRFSIMGDASGPLARTVTADAWRGTVTVTSRAGTRVLAAPLLDWLEEDLRGVDLDAPPLPFDFALGWVGYLGYELKAQCGAERAHRSPTPDAQLVFADRALVLDHLTGTTHLLALAEEGADAGHGTGGEEAPAWLAGTAARLAPLAGAPAPADDGGTAAPAAPPSAPMATRLRHTRERYLHLIEETQAAIAAGETYELCLTNMLEADADLDVWHSYLRLRRAHPAPYAALLEFGETAVLSTSPERFLKVTPAGIVESRPIKGTRPRGATPEEDARLRGELARDEKDRAENLMIVDLVRHDLGRVAETGSVHVPELFAVETHASTHQLVSTVRARLRPGATAVSCVRAAFPGGSMTGAPKERTMRLIDELEAGPRGVYSGALGYLSLSGAADLSIVIRTLVATPGRVAYGVGGAVVALSEPAAEFEETAVKAAPFLSLLGAAFPGREAGG